MNTTETVASIPAELRAELQATLDEIAKGIRNREKMKTAAERMDRMRERNRELFGDSDVGVEIVREMRDSQ